MSNYTILEENTLLCFEHEDTKAFYLRGSQSNEIKAFYMAYKWQDYLRELKPILLFAANLHKNNSHIVKTSEAVANEVLDFIKERHFRSYFPQN